MFNENGQDKFSLKYREEVPEGYDISEMQFTFDFIYLVFKCDSDIDSAIKRVSGEYDLSESYLKKFLIENKFILNKINKIEFSKRLKKYNTKSLKKILKKHNLKTSGKRSQIEQRIFRNNLLGDDYHLSSKSRVFYKNKKRRMDIFADYLTDYYYFNEFNDFYMQNYRKKRAKIPVEYIKRHIDKATDDRDHERFISNTQIMADHFLIRDNYKEMLEHVLKIFCMNLNPVWKIDDLKNHVAISRNTHDNLNLLEEKIGKNRIISAYYVIWDSFNFEKIIVPKYEGYRCLKDMLNQKDYLRINQKLDEKFYGNLDLKIKKITQKTLFDF